MMIDMAKRDLMEMAYQLVESNGLIHPYARVGLQGFRETSPRSLPSACRGNIFCWCRVKGFNRENVNEFYDKLHTLIDMHGVDATRMSNRDESGITTVQKRDKVRKEKT